MKHGRTAFSIPVAGWNAWDGRAEQGTHRGRELDQIEPLLRRRLSPLGRTALASAFACTRGEAAVRVVFASRHGELARSVDLLEAIARDEALSPTVFGLSVLNATAGIYAMARQDRSEATAIAAGPETLTLGLIDAWTRACHQPGPPVLYLYADAPVPDALAPLPNDVETTLALAVLIDPQAPGRLELGCEPSNGTPTPASQAATFLSVEAETPAVWQNDRRRWTWAWRQS